MATVQSLIKIGLADHGRRMTMDEFLDAEEDPNYLYELARGVLEVSEVPNDPHGEVVYKLDAEFVVYDRAHPGLIRWIGHGSDVRLRIPEMISDRHPDLAIVFRGTPRNARGRRAPRLVVEVVSPGKDARDRDYVAKREEYLALGLEEYWIVDPRLQHVTILSRIEANDGPTGAEQLFQGGQTLASPLLPGLATTVDSLWSESDGEDEE